jgi:glycosyltransferase involved in cell wall biosynthesis
MKVSVIIPNYNHVAYLAKRIESVLDQTFQDFELIILDDKSTDNSRKVIEQYNQHPKVSQIIFNEQNSGSTFKQWLKGIELSRGELIWLAESDDMADPEFLATLVQIMDREPKVGIAYANSYYIDADDKILRTYTQEFEVWSDRWQYDYINNGSDEVVRYLRFSPVILNVSSCIFRKSLFLKVGGCSEDFKLAGDWMTYVKMLQFADISYIARPLNYFRTHGQTVRSTSKQFVQFFENIKVICYIYKNFPVSAMEKKAQAYTILAQFKQLAPEFTVEQRAIIMSYLRRNFMKRIDLLRWKYEASILLRKVISF